MIDLLQPHAMIDLLYHLHIKFKKYMFHSHELSRHESKFYCALYPDYFYVTFTKATKILKER